MHCKTVAAIGILAGCVLVFSFGQEKASGREKEKLLHTELLKFERPPLKKSLRNIFTPFQGKGPDRIPGKKPGGSGRMPGDTGTQPGEEGSHGAENSSSSLPRIDLKYIGYVGNEERKVALIFRGGEALAVIKEEILPDGVKIIRISSEEVEVELPGGENIKFSLEGEK